MVAVSVVTSRLKTANLPVQLDLPEPQIDLP